MAESAAAAASSGPEHHALKDSWSFWEQRVEKKGDEKWRERALKVCTVDTVESFWSAWSILPSIVQYFGYGALQAPVQIEREDEKESGVLRTSTCSEYKIFRSHIEPFGDCVDADGKRYSLSRVEARFTPRRPTDLPEILELWEKVVLGLIGETLFSDNSVVNGAKFSNKTKAKDEATKTQWRLEVWLSLDSEDPEQASKGKALKKEFEKIIGMLSKTVDFKKVD